MKKIVSIILATLLTLSALLSVGAQNEIPPVEQVFTTETDCYFVRDNTLFAYNLETLTETQIEPFVSHILDIYDNQYLYYAYADYLIRSDEYEGCNIWVYNIDTKETTRILDDVADITRAGDKVYLEELNGVSSAEWLKEANLDGSDVKTISDSSLSKVFIKDEMYFCEIQDHSDFQNPISIMKKYNIKTGEMQTLTAPFVGFVYASDISADRALVRSGWDEPVVSVSDFESQKQYTVEGETVYVRSAETDDKKALLSGKNISLYDVYQDKYLYAKRQNPVMEHMDDCVIYDLSTEKEICVIENIENTLLINDRIYTATGVSDISPSTLTSYALDGTDAQTISVDLYIRSLKQIGQHLYYCNFENSDYYNPTSDIRRYDTLTGTTEILTPRTFGVANRHGIDTEGARMGSYSLGWQEYIYYTEEADKDITVTLNGDELTFDRTPINYKNRVMVPVRTIFEALGYEVSWDSETDTAIATKGEDTIYTTIGKSAIVHEDGISYSDVAPINVSGRVMVPIRAIAESTGCTVDWDSETKTVLIKNK